ncbi:MAG TPA: sulfatase-like hydrolase/transferase, partial [Chloroflexota bacterium]|nr:sulfatase-like hydrolase/transferase [Chloroflexota bacterium]
MTRAADPRPNILIVFSDQQRWDTLGVNGSPMGLTPHLDRLAREGTRFVLPITNQPVCAPARACLLSGQYATSHGVWRNGFGLAPDTPTLATCLAGEGYQTGYVGKWHLAGREHGHGAVPPEARGGFADFWEAANVPELVSRPFETVLYDGAGAEVRPPGYRVDATTDRTIAALRHFAGRGAGGGASSRLAGKGRPFVQMVSFLEPHHQNDVDRYVPPEGYEARYANPFVPPDLRPLP